MKLYYCPGAYRPAAHIVLHEAGLASDFVEVDLKARRTDTGEDLWSINPKVACRPSSSTTASSAQA